MFGFLLVYFRFLSTSAAAPMTAMITTAATTISKVSVEVLAGFSTAVDGDAVGTDADDAEPTTR